MHSKLYGAIIAAMALVSPMAAQADTGHSHEGMHEERQGHAAALGHPADPTAKARIIEVAMNDNMRFSPDTVTVRRGETIRFVVKNGGDVKHEMVLGTARELREHAKMMAKFPGMEHDDPNAVTAEPGQTKTLLWTFTKSGNFDFACLVPGHFESGMKGRIIVK